MFFIPLLTSSIRPSVLHSPVLPNASLFTISLILNFILLLLRILMSLSDLRVNVCQLLLPLPPHAAPERLFFSLCMALIPLLSLPLRVSLCCRASCASTAPRPPPCSSWPGIWRELCAELPRHAWRCPSCDPSSLSPPQPPVLLALQMQLIRPILQVSLIPIIEGSSAVRPAIS